MRYSSGLTRPRRVSRKIANHRLRKLIPLCLERNLNCRAGTSNVNSTKNTDGGRSRCSGNRFLFRDQRGKIMDVLLMVLIAVVVVAARFIVLELRGIKNRIGATTPTPDAARLVCSKGNHYIGNQPYTLVNHPDDDPDDGELVCLRCIEQARESADALLKETQELLDGIKEKEIAEEREWSMLTEAEKQARQKLFLDGREKNIAEWSVRGEDGIWRRKDDGAVVEQDTVEKLLEKYVLTAKGNLSIRQGARSEQDGHRRGP